MVKHNNNSYEKTIAVFMIMITAFVFLSVNVYAETDFGYAASVSNQDSINGVVITLKANRGSLVNSGTAALGYSGYCPVLITVTLQNTNSQNVLINNLKFKVTTNSSGNFSRIVSFEQLSNDLIVAETPYDLNNYISIVPSSDYSYGTGIVVPSNSSMYMVCIMNVYANYDTSSNQWQVPSLQYIGYDQNITVTTGDYSYNGEPVDLSGVESLISDIELNIDDIKQLVQYIVSPDSHTYTYTVQSGYNVYRQKDIYNNSNVVVRSQVIQSVNVISDDIEVQDYLQNGTVNDHIVVELVTDQYITFANNNANSYSLSYSLFNEQINPSVPNGWTRISKSFEALESNVDYSYSFYYDSDTIYLSIKQRIPGTLKYWLYPLGYQYVHFRFKRYYIYNSNNSNVNVSFDFGFTDNSKVADNAVLSIERSYNYDEYVQNNEQNLNVIKLYLKGLYESYNNVNGVTDSSDISNDVSDVTDSNHTIEESYYSANASAIEATGLSNYRFSNEQNNGIGKVADDFMLLWNALGSWNGVYIFSLTIALATFIMRHGGLFTIKRETSDKGGEVD